MRPILNPDFLREAPSPIVHSDFLWLVLKIQTPIMIEFNHFPEISTSRGSHRKNGIGCRFDLAIFCRELSDYELLVLFRCRNVPQTEWPCGRRVQCKFRSACLSAP